MSFSVGLGVGSLDVPVLFLRLLLYCLFAKLRLVEFPSIFASAHACRDARVLFPRTFTSFMVELASAFGLLEWIVKELRETLNLSVVGLVCTNHSNKIVESFIELKSLLVYHS